MAATTRSAQWLAAQWRGGSAEWITLRGGSMTPTLAHGDRLLVAPLDGTPRAGEIVVLLRDGQLVTHRLVRIVDGRAVTRGDAMVRDDPSVDVAELLGRVTAVERRPWARWRRRLLGA